MEDVEKITIKDFYRLSEKTSDVACNVKKGDVVMLPKSKYSKNKSVIGMVIKVYEDKMCLLVNNSKKQWWSRFVKCEVVAYNKQ